MRITCVHQGFELYGSDRSFVETVRVMRAAYPGARIDVVLPRHGPIVEALEPLASRILFEPLWILRRRGFARLATVGLLALPIAVARAIRRIRQSDLTYVNTSVVADYLLAAGLCPGRTVAHLHEIPEGVILKGLRAMVRWSRAEIVFNSRATQRAFAMPAGTSGRVVYNGIADPGLPKPMTYDGNRPLRLLTLGRISRIKGQDVLVEALARLPQDIAKRIEVRIVGSSFEDKAREDALAASIRDAGLAERVTLLPFVSDPSAHFLWADIVAVPSCLPESLGRVAIEAMAYAMPPLVSDIGGLPEVVADGRTGWVVPPGDAAALCEKLTAIVAEPKAWSAYPAAARARYQNNFGEAASAAGMIAAFDAVLSRRVGAVAALVEEPARS